jgi:DNA-directed RNA polymerase subunit RPC12/RpoP
MAKKRIGYGSFFCWNCGNPIEKEKRKCPHCGAWYSGKDRYMGAPALGAGGIGWSDQAGHPGFKKYVKRYRRYALFWLIGLSILVPGILLAVGDLRPDREGLTILAVIVGILWFVGLLFLVLQFGRNHRDWEGVGEDKTVRHETRRRKDANGNAYFEPVTVYTVHIRKRDGSLHRLTGRDDDREYAYYRIGEYVRYHGSKYLKYLEKYDKSGDEILFCASCKRANDIRNRFCEYCGSILLKGPAENQS